MTHKLWSEVSAATPYRGPADSAKRRILHSRWRAGCRHGGSLRIPVGGSLAFKPSNSLTTATGCLLWDALNLAWPCNKLTLNGCGQRHIAEIYPASNKAWSASVESLHHDFTGRTRLRACGC